MRKEGKRGHREGTSRKKKPEISRKLVSIKAEKKKKKIALRCGLQCVRWILQQVSHFVTLEKAVSKIWWGRNNEVN